MEIDSASGWNWFSVNALSDDMTVNSLLSNLSLVDNDYIKGQTSNATYFSGFGWYPNLDLSLEEFYMLNLANSGTMNYEGAPTDPADYPIDIASGWNWVGYLPQSDMDVNSALASLSIANNDYIKGQTANATYFDGFGWQDGLLY